MESTTKALSENVSKRRSKLGMTQSMLAEKAGFSLNMIQKVEYQKSWPSPDTLEKIASALDCEPWELLRPESAMDRRLSQLKVNEPKSAPNPVEVSEKKEEITASELLFAMQAYGMAEYENRLVALAVLREDPSLVRSLGISSAVLALIKE